jgi:nucleotide-binding universal stress UspA family protein
MTSLLIAYDGSHRAAEATVVAARLFPGARAIVLSVAHDPWDPEPAALTTLTLAGPAVTPARRGGTSTARAIAQRGCDRAGRAGLSTELLALAGGRPAIKICRAARRHDVDLIVCGTHGHTAHRRSFLGSTAMAVMHHAQQPVLVVPEEATTATGPVVVAYDGSEAGRSAIRAAGRLLAGRESVVVHAGSDSLIARKGAALARELGLRCTNETVAPEPDAPEALIAAAHRAGAPVVIAGSRGRGAITSTLLGSFSTALLREAALPVLIAKDST